MIRLFTGRRRIVFFQKGWANAVTRWLLGVHSPSGTIDIRNTATPGDACGASFDVNLESVSRGVRERLKQTFCSHQDVRDEIEKSSDGTSLVTRGGKLAVNDDWIREFLDSNVGDGFVKTTGDQAVAGTKTFTSGVNINTTVTNTYFVITNSSNSTRGYFGAGDIWLDKNSGSFGINFRDFNRAQKARIYFDYSDNTLNFNAGAANKLKMTHSPDIAPDSASTVVASCGWVSSKFIPVSKLGVSGGVAEFAHTHANYAATNHTHSGYAATNHTHGNYALTSHDHDADYAALEHEHDSSDVTGLDTAITNKITALDIPNTYVKVADYPGEDIDAMISYFEATQGSNSVTVVTGVTWNGTALKYSSKNLTFANGLLTGVTNNSDTTVDTPTVISWS